MNTKIIIYTLAVTATLFLSSCNGGGYSMTPPTDTAATNVEREKAGVRPIKKDWKFRYTAFGKDGWLDASGVPAKFVQREGQELGGRILYEQDNYYSGRKYQDPANGEMHDEKLVVTYDWTTKTVSVAYIGDDAKITAALDPLESGTYGQYAHSNKETLRIANDILVGWGRGKTTPGVENAAVKE